ncbi:DUF4190 domain-containing protein [Ruania halotolerans]|uniref:DUF4190 domain-containing protein n=1 Tax=Ruania halotolerans TaxID=2897773 RepID=UPI001E43CEC4|nr:DUF4190 domain-containing protein [Ruania halotolerans]UFU07094.1 DUF4190 domain-containing protein [Ruania halotolerans]
MSLEQEHRGASPFVNSYTLPLPDPVATFSGPGYHSSPAPMSGFAIAAFVLGLLGVPTFALGFGGVIFGIVALRHIRRTNVRGLGLATTGLVIGALAVTTWSLILAAFWLFG